MREFIVKSLVLLVFSANLTWAAEQGVGVSGACASVDVVSVAGNGDESEQHTPDTISHHCSHASVHFTGLPDTSVSIPRGPSSTAPLAELTDWQSRDVEPRLRPPRV
ncbi:hypothetical protein LV475_09405 [Guyparkeria hydrothermalis]|uniref:hypothetical protein n=1 Tax=Guyparkeria TaxID=2035712 RepID=UPI000F64E807|nr:MULTISPECIES: hypothetical protein [Guyparkeria]MCL7751806.1 hypothetical protein [Guyparkeria hydrothermalis]